MTENHFGPSAVNVITKTCSGEIRTVSQAQETKVHKTRSDFFFFLFFPVLVSRSVQETKVFQLWGCWARGEGNAGPAPLAEPREGSLSNQTLNNV